MPAMPNPFLTSAAMVMPSAEPAVASRPISPEPEATAEPIVGPSPDTSALLDEICHVHEIFYARKTRFVLDEEAFFAAIEPPPLFLQAAAE